MAKSSLKKIKPTKVMKDASMVREGLLEVVTFKDQRRLFKVDEIAFRCKPGRTLTITPLLSLLFEGEDVCSPWARGDYMCSVTSPGSGMQENRRTGWACKA